MNGFSLTVLTSIANSANVTKTFINHLGKMNLSDDTVYVLCIDGHIDSENEEILKRFLVYKDERSQIIKNDIPLGVAKTLNIALNTIETDFVLLMDSDVFLDSDSLRLLFTALQSHDVAAVQPLLVYPQDLTIQSYGHVFGPNFNNHALKGQKHDERYLLPTREAQALTTACQLFKRNIFIEVGGYDEDYYNAYEGMELSIRYRQLGYKTLVVGEAIGFHFQGKSRKNVKLNESIANAKFWSTWSHKIKTDFTSFYNKKLWPEKVEYKIVNISNFQSWKSVLEDYFEIYEEDYALRTRGEGVECWECFPLEFIRYPGLLVFLCDHFSQLNNNNFWFYQRGTGNTLILDMHGNQRVV